MASLDIAAAMGRVGLPAPISELARRDWDAVVVGGGHNGLTAAAYLAMAGQSVLVLERRERLGGACTLERPFPDPGYAISPCAYVVGMLDERVVSELALRKRGYRVFLTDPGNWSPFEDGTSFASFPDPERTRKYLRAQGFAEAEIDGVAAYDDVFSRARLALSCSWRARICSSFSSDMPGRARTRSRCMSAGALTTTTTSTRP